MPRGRRPTAIVAIAPTVRGEITVMLLLTSLLTYNTGSGVGATSAAPTSGATSRRTALPRHEPDVIAPSRSIVEDRLIDVDRPVEPPDAVAPADRSEEHTSELQSQSNLVCRLLLEKKKSTPVTSLILPNSTPSISPTPISSPSITLLHGTSPTLRTTPRHWRRERPPSLLTRYQSRS